jgi:hypothetical protein
MKNWRLYIGNGVNFKNTIKDNIWRIQSDCSYVDYFLNKVKNGDILWFVLSGVWNDNNGYVICRAVYINHKIDSLQDIEIHYSNLTDYRKYNLYSNITSNIPVTICKKPPEANDNDSIESSHKQCNDIQYTKRKKTKIIKNT